VFQKDVRSMIFSEKKGPGVPLLGIFLGIFLRCISDEILFGDSKGNSCEHGIYMYIEINNI